MPPVVLVDERRAVARMPKGQRAAARPFTGTLAGRADVVRARARTGSIRGDASAIVCSMTPLVTTIDDEGANPTSTSRSGGPTVIILFNEKSGPTQVADIIAAKHSFIQTEVWETTDEQDRPAWLLTVVCETATGDQLLDLIGSRLPDYIQARRFPPSRMELVRRTGTRIA
jgi:hypothetical protein